MRWILALRLLALTLWLGLLLSPGLGEAAACGEALAAGTLRREVAAARDAYFVVELEVALDRLIAIQERIGCMQEAADPADLRDLYFTLGAVLLALDRREASRRAIERGVSLVGEGHDSTTLGQEVRLLILDVRETSLGRAPTRIVRDAEGAEIKVYFGGAPLAAGEAREPLAPGEHFVQHQVAGGWSGKWIAVPEGPGWRLLVSPEGLSIQDPAALPAPVRRAWYAVGGVGAAGAGGLGLYGWSVGQARRVLDEASSVPYDQVGALESSYSFYRRVGNAALWGGVAALAAAATGSALLLIGPGDEPGASRVSVSPGAGASPAGISLAVRW